MLTAAIRPGVSSPSRLAGFSLVELMIAMVLGLIVIGAVIALVLSMIRANNQTIKSTRLNQELRATLSVVANDFKRARAVLDPLTAATQTAVNNLYVVDVATAGCIRYGYEGGVDGNWRSIRRDSDSERLVMAPAAAQASAACDSAGIPLGSDQVKIQTFTVTPIDANGTAVGAQAVSRTWRRYQIELTGYLADSDSQLGAIRRTMRQSVYVRSIGQ